MSTHGSDSSRIMSTSDAETESSNPDTHKAEGYHYGRREIRGTQFQKWIDGNGEACPVKPIQLPRNDLMELISRADIKFTRAIAPELAGLGLGPGPNGEFARVRVEEGGHDHDIPAFQQASNLWGADVGEGFLCIPEIFRFNKAGHFSSEVLYAIYTHFYPIESLSQCIFTTVDNINTRKFVYRLYKANGYPVSLGRKSDFGEEEVTKLRTWEFGTAEYKALLGTRIGGVVATLVLGAFPRGTKRITNIQTWFKPHKSSSGTLFTLDMRFNISTVEN